MAEVTVSFFAASLQALAEQHGDKDCPIEKLEEIRRLLGEAERAYREIPSREGGAAEVSQ